MVHVAVAELNNPEHAKAVIYLLNEYAKDPMGGGDALSEFAQTHLIGEMKKRKNISTFLAFVDHQPVGLCICVEGFSTFQCKTLFNIHDLVVLKPFRGRGIAKSLLSAVRKFAEENDYCKLTLEVLTENKPAQQVYRSLGFAPYELDPTMGSAQFWQLKL